jgi:hypothetical protein
MAGRDSIDGKLARALMALGGGDAMLEHDTRNANIGLACQSRFNFCKSRISFNDAIPMAVGMDHDIDNHNAARIQAALPPRS